MSERVTSLIAFCSLDWKPLTEPSTKMNSAGSSILNCRNRSTLALTPCWVGASLMGALNGYSRVVLTM